MMTPNKGKNRVSPLSPPPIKVPNKVGRPRKSSTSADKSKADQVTDTAINNLDNFGGTSGALGAKPKTKDGPKAPQPKLGDIKNFFKPQTSARKTEDDV
jgi:hypothetical protein